LNFILGDVGLQGLPGISGMTVKGEKGLPGKFIRLVIIIINSNKLRK